MQEYHVVESLPAGIKPGTSIRLVSGQKSYQVSIVKEEEQDLTNRESFSAIESFTPMINEVTSPSTPSPTNQNSIRLILQAYREFLEQISLDSIAHLSESELTTTMYERAAQFFETYHDQLVE